MSGRRALLKAPASVALASPLAGLAQAAAKNARVAVLEGGFAGSAAAKQFGDPFVQALAALGWKEGVNLHVDRRHAEGKLERLPALAMELAQAKPDVILAPTRLATEAVLKATRTIPVVFANFPDPVKAGAVASLSRPGGNATGFTHITFELTGKRLELLKEVIPRLRRLGALHTADVTSLDELAELRHIAEGLGIEVIVAEAKNSEAYEDAFALLRQARVDAVFLLTSIANFLNRKISADLALKYRLPTVTELSGYPESGGLMSYGVNLFDLRRKAAGYVDRILRGAKPADLPVQRPTEFELVINLKTAKALGIRIPQSILLRADRVIE